MMHCDAARAAHVVPEAAFPADLQEIDRDEVRWTRFVVDTPVLLERLVVIVGPCVPAQQGPTVPRFTSAQPWSFQLPTPYS